jgi:hypothetical protein
VRQSCYGAFESLNPASPRAILAKVEDEEKRKHLNELLIAAKSYLQAGRHVSKSGAQIGEFAGGPPGCGVRAPHNENGCLVRGASPGRVTCGHDRIHAVRPLRPFEA